MTNVLNGATVALTNVLNRATVALTNILNFQDLCQLYEMHVLHEVHGLYDCIV